MGATRPYSVMVYPIRVSKIAGPADFAACYN